MPNIIKRTSYQTKIKAYLKQFRVVALIGPRQCGKTTLAREVPAIDYFDLDNPRDIARLSNPQLALEDLEGTIVIDEIQRNSELFPILRFLVDSNSKQKYLILGSASPELISKSLETLAGRIGFIELTPFSVNEYSLARKLYPNISRKRYSSTRN